MSANTPQPMYSRVKATWRAGELLSCSLTSGANSSSGFASSHRRIVSHFAASYLSQPSGQPVPFQPRHNRAGRKMKRALAEKENRSLKSRRKLGDLLRGGYLTPVRFADEYDPTWFETLFQLSDRSSDAAGNPVAPTQAAISNFSSAI